MQIARRYARALYEEARRQSNLETVDADIELIGESLESAPQLKSLFLSPVISRDKKEAVVSQLFKGRVSDLTLRFMQLLIAKQREDQFPDVVRSYRSMRDEELGVVRAEARVAAPLSEADERQLVTALERLTGKIVRIEVSQQEDLLGGVIVRIGDTVYDGSVRNQLARLREQMETRGFSLN